MRLGEILKRWRIFQDISVRQAGSMVGVSGATWSRLERGFPPDSATTIKLINWMFGESNAR